MKKINEISANKYEEGQKNDLYTRYKMAFDQLLNLNTDKENVENDYFYIPDDALDAELNNVLDEISDSLSILIGYAGIGKSTSLRHFYHYSNSVPVLIKNDSVLIFPATFNGIVPDIHPQNVASDLDEKEEITQTVKKELMLRIKSVCTFLEQRFPMLREDFISEQGQEKFYNLLLSTNPKVLEHIPYEEKLICSAKEERIKRLGYAFEKEGFICAITQLKYYLSSDKCTCKKVIAILDDIEPLPYAVQLSLLMQYGRLLDCLQNMTQKKYIVNILIALRPHTYRIMKEYRAFKAYYVTREILKVNMVNMAEYIERKIIYYSKEIPKEKQEAWENACNVLHILCNKFDSKFTIMIKNLVNWNTRDALEKYKTVLENRVWIQRNMEKNSGFVLSEDNFLFNNITVLRALSCENRYIYSSQNQNFIPNIMYNTPEKNYALYILYIIKIFLLIQRDKFYGTESLSFNDIKKIFSNVFPEYESIVQDIDFSVKYMYKNKILRKSINDTEKVEDLDNAEELNATALLYLSPKGYELWEMLGADSVYMELCREDYYRDYNNLKNNNESSFELMQKGQQILIFYDLFLFLFEILLREEAYLNYAIEHSTIDHYISYFGDIPLSKQLYIGIDKSIKYSGNAYDEEIIRLKDSVDMKINDLEKKL